MSSNAIHETTRNGTKQKTLFRVVSCEFVDRSSASISATSGWANHSTCELTFGSTRSHADGTALMNKCAQCLRDYSSPGNIALVFIPKLKIERRVSA